MRQFRVYLTGQSKASGTLLELLPSPQRHAIQRQYRTYLPAPHWLPETPVHVWLTGRNGKVLPKNLTLTRDYELPLLEPAREQPRLKRMFLAAAAAAAVILPAASQGATARSRGDEARPALPPSVNDPSVRPVYDCGPPTAALTVGARRDVEALLPLLDTRGRPVELGAFHSNVVTHTNGITAHTNNPQVPHSNVWQNHSNVPGYTVPHTNVVPGDFIF